MHSQRAIPERVGPYRVVSVIGGGGMGVVYRAVSPTGEEVAVKVLQPERASETVIARFELERRIRLVHPNVIEVKDDGFDHGMPYLVLELLEGQSLEEILAEGPLPPERATELLVQVCAGVAFAHEHGIIHRDLKPANLFVRNDGVVKVLDFGVARVHTGMQTSEGLVIGTLSYLSPEQARSAKGVDGRTDVWALGVVLYECLTGRTPFVAGSPVSTLFAIMTAEPLPPRTFGAPTTRALDDVVLRCLRKEAADRFSGPEELAYALATLSRQASTLSIPPPTDITLRQDEQRTVALLLAQGVADPGAVARAIRSARGAALPMISSDVVGLFGLDRWDGDELDRALACALSLASLAERVAVSPGRAHGSAGGVAGGAIELAERALGVLHRGVAMPRAAIGALSGRVVVGGEAGEFAFIEGLIESASPRVELVGRGPELHVLRGALQRAVRDGEKLVVTLEGTAGVGKSALLAEVLRIWSGLTLETGDMLRASCRHDQTEAAFAVLSSALRERLLNARATDQGTALQEMLADLSGDQTLRADQPLLLSELLGLPTTNTSSIALDAARSDPQLMNDLMRIALEDFLALLVGRGPLAVVVDHAQWAESASLDVLRRALATAPGCLVLVLVGRPGAWADAVWDGGRERVLLEGLSREALQHLARQILGTELDPDLLSALERHTNGNPLFVEHTLRLWRERRVRAADGDLPRAFTVEAALEARLRELPDDLRQSCRALSVEVAAFDDADAAALGVDPSAVEGLLSTRLLSRDVYGRGATLRFASELVRDIAYATLLPETRRELHRRLASHAILRGVRDAAEIAMHLDRGEDIERALEWYLRASREAVGRGDSATLLRTSGRVLELDVPSQLRFEIHLARADALRFQGRRPEQGRELELANRFANNDTERGLALAEHVAWLGRTGQTREAISLADAAVRAAERSGDPSLSALARGRRAEALMFAGKHEEAAQALDSLDTRGLPPRLAAMIAEWRGRAAVFASDVATARARYAEAANAFELAGDLRRAAGAEANLAETFNRVGAFAEAVSVLEHARQQSRRVGNVVVEGYVLANLGYARAHLGQHDAAAAALGEAAALARQNDDARLGAFVDLYRARARLLAGDAGAALDAAVALAVARNQAIGLRVGALAVATLASIALGRSDEALAHVTEAVALFERSAELEEDESELFVAHAAALAAVGEAGRSRDIARDGLARLQARSLRIRDEQTRARYLGDVPHHRELARLAR